MRHKVREKTFPLPDTPPPVAKSKCKYCADGHVPQSGVHGYGRCHINIMGDAVHACNASKVYDVLTGIVIAS